MAFPKIDCYIEVDIVNDPRFSTQNANLILPLSIQQRNDIFVALTYKVYEHSTRLYDNVKLAIFEGTRNIYPLSFACYCTNIFSLTSENVLNIILTTLKTILSD